MALFKTLTAAACFAGFAGVAQADVSHVVFFELNDNSPEKIEALIDGAQELLCDIDGVTACEVGSRMTDRTAGSNDQAYDVALVVTLDTPESLKGYDTDPSHLEFIGKFRENWKNVRVMDSNLVDAE
tara:strand:- start:5607 stop:5987 length:381 start_codon:yes stop_codon:yes gene_type:complete